MEKASEMRLFPYITLDKNYRYEKIILTLRGSIGLLCN